MGLQMTGIGRRLIGYTETTFGQIPGTPLGLVLPIVSSSLVAKQSRDQDQTLEGYRGMPRGARANKQVAGSLTVNAAPGSIGFFLQHLFGIPTTTGAAAPYTHTFAPNMPGNAHGLPPGFTVEDDQGANYDAAERYIRYQGCRINQGKFSLKANGFLASTFDLIGADFSRSGTALDSTPTDNGQQAFPASSAVITLNSGGVIAAPLTQFDLTVSNNLDSSNYTLGGGGVLSSLPEGNFDLSGSLTYLLQDDALLAKIIADGDFTIAASVLNGLGDGSAAGDEKLTFNIPSACCDLTTPAIPGPKGISVQVNFNSFRTSGETGVTAVLLSPLAGVDAS